MWNTLTAWLISHLVANNSASVEVMLIVWWIVLAKILQPEHTCGIKVTILFLMLVSKITMTVFENLVKITDVSVLDFFSLQFTMWKEKWSEKLFTNWKLDESSL